MSRDDSATESVLITGAASGLGRELAREFARRGHPVFLVAPVAAEVRETAAALSRETGGTVHALVRDLRAPGAANEIFTHLEDAGVSVGILVNNASFGYCGNFWEIPVEQDREMLEINIEAGLRLTKLFLPGMIARGRGRIVNTASVGGFEPAPLLAVYHATKAFVVCLSQALAAELRDTGVTVTALCPGTVAAEVAVDSDIDNPCFSAGERLFGPDEVARSSVEAILHGDRVSMPGLGVPSARRFFPAAIPREASAAFLRTAPRGAA